MPILNYNYQGKLVDEKGQEHAASQAQILAARGPVLQVAISQLEEHQQALAEKGMDLPPPVNGLALIDTGASQTCIDAESAAKAGMAVVGTGHMTSATHENHEVPLFAGRIDVAGLEANISVNRAMGANLASQGIIALIGRDVLSSAILIYNGSSGTISLAL